MSYFTNLMAFLKIQKKIKKTYNKFDFTSLIIIYKTNETKTKIEDILKKIYNENVCIQKSTKICYKIMYIKIYNKKYNKMAA